MSSSANNSTNSSSRVDGSVPDKAALYQDYRRTKQWQDNLYRKAAHKSLDIADDELGIDSRTTNVNGIGTLGAIGIALASGGLPVLAMLGYSLLNRPDPPAAPVAPPAVVQPTVPVQPVQPGPGDSEYEVRFYDKDGNLIPVPHISTKPPE